MAKMTTVFEVTNNFTKNNPVGHVWISTDKNNPKYVGITVEVGGIGGHIAGGRKDVEKFAVNILKALKSKHLNNGK